jgi:putative membrane protein insertion efficiency factor
MSNLLIKLIKIYQKTMSPDRGFLVKIGIISPKTCVFYPSCSEYTISAILKYGAYKGLYKGIKRIIRCHPWQKKHIDPLL